MRAMTHGGRLFSTYLQHVISAVTVNYIFKYIEYILSITLAMVRHFHIQRLQDSQPPAPGGV